MVLTKSLRDRLSAPVAPRPRSFTSDTALAALTSPKPQIHLPTSASTDRPIAVEGLILADGKPATLTLDPAM